MPSMLTNLPSLKSRSGVKPRPCFSHLRITPKFKKRYSTLNLGVTLHHNTVTQRKRANPCEIDPFMCGNFNEDYLRACFLPLRNGFTACVGATAASVAGVSDTVSDSASASASAFGCSQHPQQHSVLASSVAQVHSQ